MLYQGKQGKLKLQSRAGRDTAAVELSFRCLSKCLERFLSTSRIEAKRHRDRLAID